MSSCPFLIDFLFNSDIFPIHFLFISCSILTYFLFIAYSFPIQFLFIYNPILIHVLFIPYSFPIQFLFISYSIPTHFQFISYLCPFHVHSFLFISFDLRNLPKFQYGYVSFINLLFKNYSFQAPNQLGNGVRHKSQKKVTNKGIVNKVLGLDG